MSNSTLKILPALMVAITAALVAQPAFGDGNAFHDFLITENSSSSLSVTYDGSPLTVSRPSLDNWTFALPTGFLSVPLAQSWQWTEPDNSNLVNLVNFGSDVTRAGFVQSDFSLNTQLPTNVDGASVLVGTDGGVDVFASFTDLGDTAAVPDTGTTFSLFGLSLMGLAYLRRKLC
jgi:VPDSG-CTERM motif